jgi:BMFP domain-containing protein YqiC
MAENSFINDLVNQIGKLLPNQAMTRDLQKALHTVVQSAFARLDLVTREEFDAQQAVLARTRAQIEALEVRLQALQEENAQ